MSKYEKVFATETLNLSRQRANNKYWLWDETRAMNLSMEAESEREAFIEALEYYQERLKKVESDHKSLVAKVDSFLEQFKEDED